MSRGGSSVLRISLLMAVVGCASPSKREGTAGRDSAVLAASYRPMAEVPNEPMALASDEAPDSPGWSGPQPVDVYIRRALAENRTVRAAWANARALSFEIPQVTALEDPTVSNTIFPIPAVAPQYSLMGYMPYDMLLAQQFPWFGTLRLRGQVAGREVDVALAALAAAQLDVVAEVKRSYEDLAFAQRAGAILLENRGLADDFLQVARERYRTASASQVDVLRAETALADLDRELEVNRQALTEARADLARLLHVSPEADLIAEGSPESAADPVEIDRLYRLAIAARPELRGRLAAIARDEEAIALARKQFYPNMTVGLIYQDMEERNASVGRAASGVPNVGLFVGFNLPIYRGKYRAAVSEAQARASADALLYQAERDQAHRDVKDLFVQARVQRNILGLFRRTNLPNARQVLDLTAADYRTGSPGADYPSVLAAWREVLQVELQVAQVEAELRKTLASLERAVGAQINEHPPDPEAIRPPDAIPEPPTTTGPFGPDEAASAP